MNKTKLIALFTLIIWLASYMVCFCCDDQGCQDKITEISQPIADSHPDQNSEDSHSKFPVSCHCFCGNQIFTQLDNDFVLKKDSPTFVQGMPDPVFVEQINLGSVYRPPRA